MENRILEGNYNNDTVVNIFFFGTGIARLTCPGRSRRPTQINKRIKKEQKKEKKREIKMEIKKKKKMRVRRAMGTIIFISHSNHIQFRIINWSESDEIVFETNSSCSICFPFQVFTSSVENNRSLIWISGQDYCSLLLLGLLKRLDPVNDGEVRAGGK